MPASAAADTHEVLNQPPPLEDRNLFEDDLPLVEALEREGGAHARIWLRSVGAFWGREPMAWGVRANEHPPVLHTHDRYGNRRDEVEFDRSWHALMRQGVRQELHARPWTSSEPAPYVVRAAMYQCAV